MVSGEKRGIVMDDHKIIFDNIEWTNTGTGSRYKAFIHGNQRLRLIEFSEGFVEPNWCTHGHAGMVLDGSFSIDYNSNLEKYGKGDIFFISSGKTDKHKAILDKSEKVMLLLFEVLEDLL